MEKISRNISACLFQASTRLESAGSSSPRLDAELLLAKAISGTRLDLIKRAYDKLTQKEEEYFFCLLKRRENLEPIAYILEQKCFMDLEFKMTPAVLIPRPDTEILFAAVHSYVKERAQIKNILDIGTGSGCLAISLVHYLKNINVTAWDNSNLALNCAKENAKQLVANSERLSFEKVNALSEKSWEKTRPFQIIMSNPPYISHDEKSSLSKDVINFEPHQALFAEEGGLQFYKMIAEHGEKILDKSGQIFLEISPSLCLDIRDFFLKKGWNIVNIIKDYSGKNRVLHFNRGV